MLVAMRERLVEALVVLQGMSEQKTSLLRIRWPSYHDTWNWGFHHDREDDADASTARCPNRQY